MLSVSLDCSFLIAFTVFSYAYLLSTLYSVSCVTNVVRISGLSILHCLYGFLNSTTITIKLIEDINNMVSKGVRVMLFNATVIDISDIPWRSVLLVNVLYSHYI
jgi:Kef-type K+ transport system membrane component KefB